MIGELTQHATLQAKTLTPDVTIAADGLIAITTLQNQGYAVLVF